MAEPGLWLDEKKNEIVRIRLLGQVEITYGGRAVHQALSKSKKARNLLYVLLLRRGEAVPFAALVDKKTAQDTENALKVLVCRTRNMLAAVDPALRDCILTKKDAYQWNPSLETSVDAFELEALCSQLIKAKGLQDAQHRTIDVLLDLYRGKLLETEPGVEWAAGYATDLERQYCAALGHYIDLLHAERNWRRIAEVCKAGLAVVPHERGWHEEMMRALLKLNQPADAMAQYEYMQYVPDKRLEEKTSIDMLRLYAEARQEDGQLDREMEDMCRDITTFMPAEGAQLVEYPVFRYICGQRMLAEEGSEMPSYMVNIKVGSVLGDGMQALAQEDTMQRLGSMLAASLRKGDLAARYTASQYVLLLRGVTAGSVRGVMERLRKAFYQEVASARVLMDYRYKPLRQRAEDPRVRAL